MIYDFRFDIAGICISLAVLITYFINRIVVTKKANCFFALLLLILFTCIFDTLSIYFLAHPEYITREVLYILNILYFLSYNTIPMVFVYLMYYSSEDNKPVPLWMNIIIVTSYAIILLLLLTNNFTHLVFTITPEKKYERTSLLGLIILYSIAMSFVLFSLGFLFFNFKKFTKAQKSVLLTFSILSGLSAIFQLLMSKYMISGFIISISIFIGYLAMENPETYIDSETTALNRFALISNIQRIINARRFCKILEVHIAELEYLNKTVGNQNRINVTKVIYEFLVKVFDKKTVFRKDNNEFVIIIKNANPITLYAQIEEIRNRFEHSFTANEMEFSLSALFTIITIPDDADTLENIMELLDYTFADISNSERSRLYPANLSLISKRHRTQKIVKWLEKAIAIEDFEVFYQPIYSIKTNKITAAEALIRLKHDDPELGTISPSEFIPIAEKKGMIIQIGNFVLREVAKLAKEKDLKSLGIDQIHINLSMVQCLQEKLVPEFIGIFEKYNLDYHFINFQITESETLLKNSTILSNLVKLQEKNISISLDNYGTGYSNLASLISLPYKDIILDKAMLWDTLRDPKAKIILNQAAKMIKDLELQLICKGIETQIQLDILKDTECDFVQGYYLSKPLNKDDFIALLETQESTDL